MSHAQSRRRFLAGISGAALGFGNLSGVSPSDAVPHRRNWRVTYGDGIEPLVRLIEETDRNRCVDVIGDRLLRGLTYQEFMSSVFLAGLRNGGDVGYYHCIYVVHAANQLALQTPVGEQVLPLFGAVDLFKGWQARRVNEPGRFGMQSLPKRLQSPVNALKQFAAAARDSDPDGVEAATIALSDTVGRHQMFGLLAKQAVLGGAVHRSILVANCWRVLEAMNWNHYRTTLRAMSRMLAADNRLREDWYLPLRQQAEKKHGALPAGWALRESMEGYTRDLLETLRSGDAAAAATSAIDALFSGRVRAGALWDTVHLAAAESLVRVGDGNALHENTSLNAQHYAFRTMANDDDRLMILLAVIKQAAEAYLRSPNKPVTPSILDLQTADISSDNDEAASDVFSSAVKDGAIEKAFTLAQSVGGAQALARKLRQVVVTKARNDAHPYKIVAAIHEDCRYVSPQWRPYLAVAPIGLQRGGDSDVTDNPDSQLILQAREELRRR